MTFNKLQLSSILQQAQGTRSLQQFSRECKVSTSYLSNMIQCKKDTAPSIEVAIKIANHSHNGVTLETILDACGHSTIKMNNETNSLVDYWKNRALAAETLCDELTNELDSLREKLNQIHKISSIP